MDAIETTTDTPPLKLAWGLAPPAGAVAAWGARAIYEENRGAYAANHTKRGEKRKRRAMDYFSISLLWDRQSAAGDKAELDLLNSWINVVGLPWLRNQCSEQYITPDSEQTVTLTDGRFTLTASPRGSFGYLYIGVWLT